VFFDRAVLAFDGAVEFVVQHRRGHGLAAAPLGTDFAFRLVGAQETRAALDAGHGEGDQQQKEDDPEQYQLDRERVFDPFETEEARAFGIFHSGVTPF